MDLIPEPTAARAAGAADVAPPGAGSTSDTKILEALRGLPLLSDLSEEDLIHLAALAHCIRLPSGTVLMEEGTVGDEFYVILDGELEVTRREGGRDVLLNVVGPGRFLSEMSLLEDRPRSASARATKDSEVLVIQPQGFRDLLARSPGASLVMLRTVMERLRSTESTLIEQGRMAGLGTLAAGLAHELNNPAAALVRSTNLLDGAMTEWHRRCAELGNLPLSPEEMQVIAELEKSLSGPAPAPEGEVGPGGNGEAELEDRLATHGLEEGWRLAPILSEVGWDGGKTDELARRVTPEHFGPLIRWLAAGIDAFGLVSESRQAAQAISEIVASVRSYSSLDRAPVQDVDVRETLENTLLILKRRLGEQVTVKKEISPDLPLIEAHGGELSQVWTNLIQNALDAMENRGTLKIRAEPTKDGVEVEIEDSGQGIPEEVRPHIFDPFFTTKPLGQGTGLGLAISYGIVVNRHRGCIRVDSRPGRTVFSVALPGRHQR